MRDSPWLASEDIEGKGDIKLTIEKVFRQENVAFEDGRSKPVVYSIQFAKAKRRLVLNATNRKQLASMFGPEVADWIGQQITLYVDPNVKMKGQLTKGIRIRKN